MTDAVIRTIKGFYVLENGQVFCSIAIRTYCCLLNFYGNRCIVHNVYLSVGLNRYRSFINNISTHGNYYYFVPSPTVTVRLAAKRIVAPIVNLVFI